MRIVVCIKQVPDLDQVRMDKETRAPVLRDVPLALGQLEKNALAEALRLKNELQGDVVALSVGAALSDDIVTECLARGADRSVAVLGAALADLSATGVAAVIVQAIRKLGGCDLVLAGEGSTDDNTGQIGPLLSEMMELPLLGYARRLSVAQNRVQAISGLEDSFETIECGLPAVATVSADINEPAIPSIIDVMDASAKPQQKWTLADIGLSAQDLRKHVCRPVLSNRYPEQARQHVIIKGKTLDDTLNELVQRIKREGALE